jgi:hypothetical protein
MIMENQDSIEEKFKSTFSDFEKEPPAQVWESLQHELHPEPKSLNFWERFTGEALFQERQLRRFAAVAGVAIFLSLAVIYFASSDRHVVKGHAYAGEARLCRGIAVLFLVGDKLQPWDSVTHYRSSMVDENGNFKFPNVEPGTYLLRIAPEHNSEASKKFMPSWFDQHEHPDSSHVIHIVTDDVNADVHLMDKGEGAK